MAGGRRRNHVPLGRRPGDLFAEEARQRVAAKVAKARDLPKPPAPPTKRNLGSGRSHDSSRRDEEEEVEETNDDDEDDDGEDYHPSQTPSKCVIHMVHHLRTWSN